VYARIVKEAIDLVRCSCAYSGGGGGGDWNWGEGGGGGKGEGGGAGCSVANQRLKEKRECKFSQRGEGGCVCTCRFEYLTYSPGRGGYYGRLHSDLGTGWVDYEKLGRLLHPIQDFWSHSTAIYVPGCKTKKCVSSVFGACLDWGCAEYYYRYYYWTTVDILTSTQAGNVGLRTGWFEANGWSALEDVACLWPPCNAHCMLNKDDDGHFSRDDFSPCDGNIQKDFTGK
jgi:hypothetical protein